MLSDRHPAALPSGKACRHRIARLCVVLWVQHALRPWPCVLAAPSSVALPQHQARALLGVLGRRADLQARTETEAEKHARLGGGGQIMHACMHVRLCHATLSTTYHISRLQSHGRAARGGVGGSGPHGQHAYALGRMGGRGRGRGGEGLLRSLTHLERQRLELRFEMAVLLEPAPQGRGTRGMGTAMYIIYTLLKKAAAARCSHTHARLAASVQDDRRLGAQSHACNLSLSGARTPVAMHMHMHVSARPCMPLLLRYHAALLGGELLDGHGVVLAGAQHVDRLLHDARLQAWAGRQAHTWLGVGMLACIMQVAHAGG